MVCEYFLISVLGAYKKKYHPILPYMYLPYILYSYMQIGQLWYTQHTHISINVSLIPIFFFFFRHLFFLPCMQKGAEFERCF